MPSIVTRRRTGCQLTMPLSAELRLILEGLTVEAMWCPMHNEWHPLDRAKR